MTFQERLRAISVPSCAFLAASGLSGSLRRELVGVVRNDVVSHGETDSVHEWMREKVVK